MKEEGGRDQESKREREGERGGGESKIAVCRLNGHRVNVWVGVWVGVP